MDQAMPVEKPSDGLSDAYDMNEHGPRAFGGQRVCLRCVLERQRVLLRERAYEISYLVGEFDDARLGAEPAMTERDVLAEQLQAALQRISHLQGQLAQVATPSHIVSLLLPVFACISRPEVTLGAGRCKLLRPSRHAVWWMRTMQLKPIASAPPDSVAA